MDPTAIIHASLGEVGAIAFIWVMVELLNPTEKRIKRAKLIALGGVFFILLSWIVGGYDYLNYYPAAKAVIKESSMSWAHGIVMEAKEHIFLLIPFVSIATTALIHNYGTRLIEDKKARRITLLFVVLSAGLALLMALMGAIISYGARVGLGG